MKILIVAICASLTSLLYGDPLTAYQPTGFKCNIIPDPPQTRVLAVAGKYLGKPYATSPSNVQWKTGQSFDCTTFITKVLQDAGFSIVKANIEEINISTLQSQEEIKNAVEQNQSSAAGVVWALVSSHQGTEVSDTDDLQEGDIVQFWSRTSSGDLAGHSAIVMGKGESGKLRLLGAHGSYSKGGSVAVKEYDLRIGQKNYGREVVAVYGVRPRSP